jgi:RsiW-degrading membrane proteinase PrsW (M82 family)
VLVVPSITKATLLHNGAVNDADPTFVAVQPAQPTVPSAGFGLRLVVVLVALLGGFLGILGSLVSEIQRGGGFIILPIIIAAPMIEEAMKPAGVYIALLKWPHALRNQLYVAVLCALGGLVFGLIESWIYVNVYVEDGSDAFVRFRYTVPVAMHVICSFVYGLGLNRSIIDWGSGHGKVVRSTRRAYIAAAVIHGTYNLMAIVLAVAGVLDFDEE